MRYVHILGAGGMYTKDFCKMLVENFSVEDHCFISGDPSHENYRIARDSGCRVYKTTSVAAIKHFHQCDFVIAHGMNNPKVLALFYLWPRLLNKTNWVIWGGDIYDNTDPKNIRSQVICAMRQSVYPKVRWATTLSRRDYEYAHKEYGLVAREFEGCYPVPASTNSQLILNLRNNRDFCGDSRSFIVQVGNSATESNCHIEALNALSRYKDENVRIFMPLNYGLEGYELYADYVESYAEKIFGKDRVFVLRDRVEGKNYLEMLSKVDVGVFNNNRQQAMGNISQLLLLGAKIYIREDISMWKHFESLGCKLNDFNDIATQSFEDFIGYDTVQRAANISIIEKRHAIDEKVRTWKKIFSEMKQDTLYQRKHLSNE